MSEPFVPKPRHVGHEPIVPAKRGTPPQWVVACLEDGCEFAHDAHGADPADAIASVAATHAAGHRLVAKSVDYTGHGLYAPPTHSS